MPDIRPIAGVRDIGEAGVAVMPFFGDEHVDHGLDRPVTGGPHPEVFARPVALAAVGMLEPADAREMVYPFLRLAFEMDVPLERLETQAMALLIMRAQDPRGEVPIGRSVQRAGVGERAIRRCGCLLYTSPSPRDS